MFNYFFLPLQQNVCLIIGDGHSAAMIFCAKGLLV